VIGIIGDHGEWLYSETPTPPGGPMTSHVRYPPRDRRSGSSGDHGTAYYNHLRRGAGSVVGDAGRSVARSGG